MDKVKNQHLGRAASNSREQGARGHVIANTAGLLAVEQHVTAVGVTLAHLAPGIAVSVLVLAALGGYQICVGEGEST